MTTIKKMLISFTAGAILGVLYAPHKGSKTRKKLSTVGGEIKDGWNSITGTIAEKIDSLQNGVDNMAESAIEKIESTQFNVNDRAGFL